MEIKLTTLLLLLTVTLQAQELSFKWAQLHDTKTEGLVNPKIVLASPNGFYTHSYETAISPILPNHVFINKFDSDAASLGNQKFELPKRNRREASLKTVFETKDNTKLFFISELAMSKDNTNILYLQEFDAATDKVKTEVELQKLTFEKLSNSGSFEVAQSSDKSKIAILTHYPQEKEGKEKIKVLVYDNTANKIWEKEYTLNYPSERGYNEKLFVTNQGKIIITKIEDESKKEPKIITFHVSDSEIVEKMISETGFYPSEYKIVEAENSDVYLAGYYTDNWKPTISMGGRKEKGVFVYNISQGKLLNKNLWTEALHKDYSGNFIGLKIIDLYIQNNEVYLIGDLKDVKEVMDKASKSFDSNFTYTTGPGVIAKVDANGTLVSTIFKYKEMEYINKMGSITSFFPLKYNNKLFLLGNDCGPALKGKKVLFGAEISEKVVIFNPFNDNGTIAVNPVWESGTGGKEDVTILATTFSKKINENTYYVYAVGRNYQSFGKMTIK